MDIQATWAYEVDRMIEGFKVQIEMAQQHTPLEDLRINVACRWCGITLRVPASEIEEARTGLLAHPPLCPAKGLSSGPE